MQPTAKVFTMGCRHGTVHADFQNEMPCGTPSKLGGKAWERQKHKECRAVHVCAAEVGQPKGKIAGRKQPDW